MKSLQETLTYQNDDLLIKFSEFYDFPHEDRVFIFEQLKKWLWVKALHAHQISASPDDENLLFHFHVMPSLRVVDELWHVFILFTGEYRAFCQEYLGVFVDHVPSLPHKKIERMRLQAELAKVFYFVGENLDVETLQLWFNGLRERYPESLIRSKYVYRFMN